LDTATAEVAAAAARDRVDFVDEHHGGRDVLCGLEQLADEPLGLADVPVEQLRPVDRDERAVGLVGDGFRQQRLPGPGRAVQQDPLGCVDV
jgi:hypothetical protein